MPRESHLLAIFRKTLRKADGTSTPMTAWRFLLLLWTATGLAVCAEKAPDVAGHAHAHAPMHLTEPWHGSPADRAPDDNKPDSSDFHYHVVMDFSAIDSDVPPTQHSQSASIEACRLRGEDEHPPEAPALEPDGPPLIRIRMA